MLSLVDRTGSHTSPPEWDLVMSLIDLRRSNLSVAEQPASGRVCMPWVVLSAGGDGASLLCLCFLSSRVRFEP